MCTTYSTPTSHVKMKSCTRVALLQIKVSSSLILLEPKSFVNNALVLLQGRFSCALRSCLQRVNGSLGLLMSDSRLWSNPAPEETGCSDWALRCTNTTLVKVIYLLYELLCSLIYYKCIKHIIFNTGGDSTKSTDFHVGARESTTSAASAFQHICVTH